MSKITKHRDRAFESFVVDDGTGTAYVDPENADLVLTTGDEFTVDGGEDPPAFIREFVKRETSIDPVGEHKRWYREIRLDVEETARVAGSTDPDAATDHEAGVMTAITEAGDAPKFFVTDDADLDLGQRMRQEVLMYFLAGGVLLAFATMFHLMG